jgi:predicted porin
MKKNVFTLAILASLAGWAHAQSNVQVYGILDTGYIKVSGSDVREGHNYSSRIGFRGTEELGSGLKATFELERRFDLNDGRNGTLPDYDDQIHSSARGTNDWQGAANVGIRGGFGALRFGKINAPGIEKYRVFDPFFFVGSGRSLGYETRLYSEQISNTVRYDAPVVNGFSGSLTYSLGWDDDTALTPGNVFPGVSSTNNGHNDGYAALLKYDHANLSLMAHIARLADSDNSWYWNAGGSYRFGPALIALGYQDVRDRANFLAHDIANRTVLVALQYEVGAGIIKAAYNYGRISGWGDNNGHTNKTVLGYTHNLSKTVSLYGILSWTDSSNAAVAAQYNPNYSRRESTAGYQLGMTYRF